MSLSKSTLPIDALLPQIVSMVRQSPLTLLEAEPGAGKTTRVPPALLDAGLGPVYVLEPRRIAARMAAQRVAAECEEPLGGRIGYRVRFEQIGGSQTRVWYMTEGVLVRQLLAGAGIPDRCVVVLDEFHERHLETDLALALLRHRQARGAPIHLVLMSATLGGQELAAKLPGVPLLEAPGRVFPVSVAYRPSSAAPLEDQVSSAVEQMLRESSGHVLVFLPGAAEIRNALRACAGVCRAANCRLLPLYADLRPEEQEAALMPGGDRKVICSTNVAESSVTIEGVTAVVDSGLARVMQYSTVSGIGSLRVQKISRSSAIQRAGRAGRTAPGIAIRLYSEEDFKRRPEHLPPEIMRADLSEPLLQLAGAGLRWEEMRFLDAPPEEQVAGAKNLLERIGGFGDAGITDAGRRMTSLPIHPRLARFVLGAAQLGAAEAACKLAALLSEGLLPGPEGGRERSAPDLDFLLAQDLSFQARRLNEQLRRTVRASSQGIDEHALEKGLLQAFPDRVGRRRGDTVLLAGGGSARLKYAQRITGDFLIALEMEDRTRGEIPAVTMAVQVQPEWLLDFFPERVSAREESIWNRDAERVDQVSRLEYDGVLLEETRSRPTNGEASSILLAQIEEAGLDRFVGRERFQGFLRRLRFAAENGVATVPEDIVRRVVRDTAAGLVSFAEFQSAVQDDVFFHKLEAQLPAAQIDRIAPTHIVLPSGRRARIEYHEDRPPSVASRLQDFFGLQQTPSVAGGAVPLTIELLAPNGRPVQVTRDLVSFWQNLYPQVRRELGRRYPRHSWPEKPC